MSLQSTLRYLFLWTCAVATVPADAALRAQAETMSLPGVHVEQLAAKLKVGPAGGKLLHVTMGALDVAALGWDNVSLEFNGQLEHKSAERWALHGDLDIRGAPGQALRAAHLQLVLGIGANTLQATIHTDSVQVEMALPLDQPTHLQMEFGDVPLPWLQGLLHSIWAEGTLGAGRLDAHIALDIADTGLRSTGSFKLRDAAFDSTTGALAAQGLSASGKWTLNTVGASERIELNSVLRGGQLLLGPLFARLPSHPAQLRLSADFSQSSTRISALHFDDGDALRFSGNMTFLPGGGIGAISVANLNAELPAAYDRYARSWLATRGFKNLQMTGALSGNFEYDAGLQEFAFTAQELSVVDPSGRIGVEQLDGGLAWSRLGEVKPTELAWQGLKLIGLPLGPANTGWQSTDDTLRLRSPVSIPLLGGNVLLQHLAWMPRASESEDSLDLALVVTGVSLPALSEVFGWPPFRGTLSGGIPGLTYSGERIELQGGLSLRVFDGYVNVTNLSLQDPFGVTPILRADIDMKNLNLAPLTKVFEFGSITGRLDAEIHDLTTINWRPVAFDAGLHTDGTGRISQRAINSLSNLGGGGLVGGLQGAVLSIFDSFGYSSIALTCVLSNEVCEMGGIRPAAGGGYLIVDGRGLPHIEVIGHQRQVDWPTLVTRLREATQGESTPRIE